MDQSRRVDMHRKRLQDGTDGIVVLEIIGDQRMVHGAVVTSSFVLYSLYLMNGKQKRGKKSRKANSTFS